jgi:hypothetical protein
MGRRAVDTLAQLLSNATKIEMMRIEARHTFPVSVNEAFAYINDMSHWSEYWPDFVRIQNPASAPGASRATWS